MKIIKWKTIDDWIASGFGIPTIYKRERKSSENRPIYIQFFAGIDYGVVEYPSTGNNVSLHWIFKGYVYVVIVPHPEQQSYTNEQYQLLILEAYDKDRIKWEKLSRLFKNPKSEQKTSSKRESIPEEVRIAVWRRDDGKCARCGSRERLEYDHIIPVSKGGGNTVRNIELLCEKCNREKSGNIK